MKNTQLVLILVVQNSSNLLPTNLYKSFLLQLSFLNLNICGKINNKI